MDFTSPLWCILQPCELCQSCCRCWIEICEVSVATDAYCIHMQYVLNSQYFWKWSKINPMKLHRSPDSRSLYFQTSNDFQFKNAPLVNILWTMTKMFFRLTLRNLIKKNLCVDTYRCLNLRRFFQSSKIVPNYKSELEILKLRFCKFITLQVCSMFTNCKQVSSFKFRVVIWLILWRIKEIKETNQNSFWD